MTDYVSDAKSSGYRKKRFRQRDEDQATVDGGSVGTAGAAAGTASEAASAAASNATAAATGFADKAASSASQSTYSSKNIGTYADVPPISSEDIAGGYKPVSLATENLSIDELEAMEQLICVDGDYASLPHPEVFNAYPPEVQRKIMEWTDRDVKARRDDESRRQDEIIRAKVERERWKQSIPAIIVVIAIICGAVTGIVTKDPMFTAIFLILALAVVIGRIASNFHPIGKGSNPPTLPREQSRDQDHK